LADCTYCSLLETIRYEYLSQSSTESFIDRISNSFEFVTPSVWAAFRFRLIGSFSCCESSR
jgi:hypothetical protein